MKDNSKKQNIKTVECVIDNADMWMFKFEHLKKNLTDYTYEDILSKQRNVETVIANFDVEYSYEIIGLFEWYWGGWNRTPNAASMQETTKKWYEKYDAELIGISHDTLSFKCRKLSEDEAQSLMQEMDDLYAEIIGCNTEEIIGCLMENQMFTLWWD